METPFNKQSSSTSLWVGVWTPSGPWGSWLILRVYKVIWLIFRIQGTLPETNVAHENPPFWWYLPGKMGIFMGYVSFREGNYSGFYTSQLLPDFGTWAQRHLEIRIRRAVFPGEQRQRWDLAGEDEFTVLRYPVIPVIPAVWCMVNKGNPINQRFAWDE